MKKLLSILGLLAALSLTACERDGPYEEAGEEVDRMGERAEQAGERVEEELEETGDALEDTQEG